VEKKGTAGRSKLTKGKNTAEKINLRHNSI
jgi:hypothetical protein